MEFDTIGKYKVLGKVGQGSMGVVYKAHDPVLNRFVAIKTISESMGADAEARKRFLREAQSAARLNHPNIVTVYDLGEEGGRVYMAMELLEGKDLRQLIGTPALASLREKLRIMEEVCDGLAFAHAKDVVHRDLKPANIHVQPNGGVKVMDFGLARLGDSEMTAKGTSMGTPNYMSPEQVRGAKTDARSDVFSLGTVFYEVLTDHKAFDADSLHTLLMKVAESEPAPPRRWVPDLPETLVRMLERAVTKDPARRFRNAGEMRSALGVVGQVLAGQLEEREGLALIERSPDADATAVLSESPVAALPPEPAAARPTDATGPLGWSRRGTLPGRGTVPGAPSPATASPSRKSVPPTHVAPPPPVAATSRWPIYVGAALLVVVLAGVLVWTRMRSPASAPASGRDIAKEQMGALTDALVTSQVELAQESLRDKDYDRAVSLAEKALRLDPANAEAKRVIERARATLADLDAAAAIARQAVQAGDTQAASAALSKVMAINPNHPVAGELAAQLNRYFRGQAEEARRTLSAARSTADRAKAGAQPTFAEAVTATRDAERLFAKGEFAVATRKFLEGRDGFDRAVRAAEAQQAAAARTPPPTTPPSFTAVPPPTAAVPVPSLATLPPAGIVHPPASSLPAAASEEPAIRRVVEEYGRAIQSKDLALFRTVKPNLSAEEEKRLRLIFKQYKSYKVNITINSLQVEGSEARVRVSRQDTIDGNPFVLQQLLTLAKGPEGWTIREIGQ